MAIDSIYYVTNLLRSLMDMHGAHAFISLSGSAHISSSNEEVGVLPLHQPTTCVTRL